MEKFTEEEIQGKRSMVEDIQEKPAEYTKKQASTGSATAEYENVQTEIPKEKGLRAWLTRNAVACCTIFIGFFSVLYLSTWVAVGHLTEFFAVPLACALISIPLILIRTDHWIMGLAGWFGALSGPFIILLELVGITSQNGRDGSFFTYLVSVYFLDAIILGVMARKGAVRNRLVVPQWEQKIRAWASRNVVAFCNVFIASFLVVYCSWFFVGAEQQLNRSLALIVFGVAFILLFLGSIPLILSKKGGLMTVNSGWLGILYVPYNFIVAIVLATSADELIFGWLGFISCNSIYTLIAVVLAFFGRRKAKKELS
ncbi:MAG: hypothetical protein AB8H12_08475 [Lewinella sp.]